MIRHGIRWGQARRALGVIGLCLWLSACGVVPTYERPELVLPGTEGVSENAAEAQRHAMALWWRRFDDPKLNQLIASALNNNLRIALQAARIREARAQLGLEKAQFYPTLGAQVEASRSKASVSANPGIAASRADRYSEIYSVAATLGYELNLFKAMASHEAAQAQLLASAYTREAVRLAVISDVVANYISLRAIQRKIRITLETIETREEGLELAKKRYKYGAISKLALLQKRALLASIRSRLPKLRRQAAKRESALAILTGKTPRQIMLEADIERSPLTDIELPDELPELLPSALVNRRPDIRAAEAALVAADARVSRARARYFPSLDLTALIGTAAMSISSLFGSLATTASIGGIITAPLLTFGRIEARVDTAQARREQAIITYRQTVRRAFKEVRNALIGIQLTEDSVDASRRQVQAYQEVLALAMQRYQAGMVGLQNVLEARRQLYNAQLALSEAIRDRFVATANLFKALGGGWTVTTDSVPDDIDTGLPQPHAEPEKADEAPRSASIGDKTMPPVFHRAA